MKKKLQIIFILFLCSLAAHSQINIEMYEQFNGRYDFTFVGNTLNTHPNTGDDTPCEILTSSSASLNLNRTDTILKAYLYWAGSGTGDYNVKLNGNEIEASRRFPVIANNTDGIARPFFSAFADVTNLVQTTGNANYTLSDLDLTGLINMDTLPMDNMYCTNGTNFGGWVIIVVYENSNLPLNQLNLYDGLQFVPSVVNISLVSLNVIDNIGAKIGFVAWEGDEPLDSNESLRINGNRLSNNLNPSGNAFYDC